jgi:hypothetical protein
MRRSQLRKSRATSLQDDPESPALRPALWQPPLPPLPNTRDLAVVVDPLGSEGFRLLALTRATMQEGSVATDDHLDAVITTPPPRYREVAAEMAPGIDRVLYTGSGTCRCPPARRRCPAMDGAGVFAWVGSRLPTEFERSEACLRNGVRSLSTFVTPGHSRVRQPRFDSRRPDPGLIPGCRW